jgi:hypothetical protein
MWQWARPVDAAVSAEHSDGGLEEPVIPVGKP